MAVVNDNIWYPGGGDTAYDLRYIIAWSVDTVDNTKVNIRFAASPHNTVQFDLADFEAAKQLSLDTSTPIFG